MRADGNCFLAARGRAALALCVLLGALMAVAVGLPGRAEAAVIGGNDACDLVGMFDKKAKKLCEAAAKAAPQEPKTQPEAKTDDEPQTPATRAGNTTRTARDKPQTAVRQAPRGRRALQYCPGNNNHVTDFDMACSARVLGKFDKAIPAFDTLCANDHPGACFELADIYGRNHNMMTRYSASKSELAQAPVLYKKSCELGNTLGCYFTGRNYDTGNVLPKDHSLAVEYYQRACDTGTRAGCTWAQGGGDVDCPDGERKSIRGNIYKNMCTYGPYSYKTDYEVPAKAADIAAGEAAKKAEEARFTTTAGLENVLSPDPDAGVTLAEQRAFLLNPYGYARLCQNGNLRACYAVSATIDSYIIPEVLTDPDTRWKELDKTTVLAAMKNVCLNNKTIKYHDTYCESQATMEYAIDISAKTPPKTSAANCLSLDGKTSTRYYHYVDQNGQIVGNAPSETQAEGTDVQNQCKYAVDFKLYGGDRSVHTLRPGEIERVGPGFLGGMLGFNSISFRWVRHHR